MRPQAQRTEYAFWKLKILRALAGLYTIDAQIKLAHVAKVPVEDLDKAMDDL